MSILLLVIGAITLVLGALAIGFGIPVNEFSFGNTLIMAGTTAVVGGLIVIGLGAVVAHLQRVAEVIAMRAPLRPNRPSETFEAGRAPATGRISFPPKPKSEPATGEAPPVEPPLAAAAAASGAAHAEEFAAKTEAPTLPNPDTPPMEAPEEIAPAPPAFATRPSVFAAAPPATAEPEEAPAAPERVVPTGAPPSSFDGSGVSEPARGPAPARHPAPPPAWRPTSPQPEPVRAPEEAAFEAAWPAPQGRAAFNPPGAEEGQPAAAPEPEPEAPAPANERRTVAVLKSGVVDGMAYTLYVDGSIEAELPQGTLRFASINDLREHLEKTS